MGQNSSVVEKFKAGVIQSVEQNNARRLYQLFMLATRHQLGEITVVQGTGAGAAAQSFIQSLRSSGPAVSAEEYIRSITQPAPNSQYISFHDDQPRQPPQQSSGRGGGGGGSGAGLSSFRDSAAPVASAALATASSYLTGISSWISKQAQSPSSASNRGSPYTTLAAQPQPSALQQQRQSFPPGQQPPAHPPQPTPSRPGYAPPTLSAEQHEEAKKAADSVAKPMAGLMSPTSPLSSGPGSQPSSLQSSPMHSQNNSALNSPNQQAQYQPPPAGPYPFPNNSPASSPPPPPPPPAAEFSRATIPININQLWVGSDFLLTYAAKQDQTSIIHLLYQAGADLEAADPSGWSALTHAAAAGSIRAVRALLDLGADPMAKTKTGLTPSQCTSSPEIRRELEVEEEERRAAIESQMAAMNATQALPPSNLSQGLLQTPPSFTSHFSSTSSFAFHSALFEIRVPVEVRAGNRFEVQVRCPPSHSEKDCLCTYYVDSEKTPWMMSPRMGSSFYIPSQQIGGGGDRYKITIHADNRALPPGLYRLIYYDAAAATFPAASNLFRVIAQPSSGATSTSGLAAWLDPNAWSNAGNPAAHIDISNPSTSSTPIILHPDFQLLSSPSPANLNSFLVPIPPYFLFSFQLNPVAVRLALELDPDLALCRDQLVPHRMKEKDFWSSYFYKMVALDWRRTDDDPREVRAEGNVQDGPIEHADTPRSQQQQPHGAAGAPASTDGGYVPPSLSEQGQTNGA